MPIASSDIQHRLSGGAANSAPLASLGGAKSSVAAPVGLFDNLDGTQTAAGSTEFRCEYIHNAHPTLTLVGAVLWLVANTPSPTTSVDVGLGTSAQGATEQTVANEATAPSGVSFSAAASKGAGIALGDIPPGGSRAVWYRRTVNAGTAAAADGFTARVEGDTAA